MSAWYPLDDFEGVGYADRFEFRFLGNGLIEVRCVANRDERTRIPIDDLESEYLEQVRRIVNWIRRR